MLVVGTLENGQHPRLSSRKTQYFKSLFAVDRKIIDHITSLPLVPEKQLFGPKEMLWYEPSRIGNLQRDKKKKEALRESFKRAKFYQFDGLVNTRGRASIPLRRFWSSSTLFHFPLHNVTIYLPYELWDTGRNSQGQQTRRNFHYLRISPPLNP